MEQSHDWRNESLPDWRSLRARIRRWIAEQNPGDGQDGGQFLREMEAKFQGCSWVEIAGWLVGGTAPSMVQQYMLWEWLQTRDAETNVELQSQPTTVASRDSYIR
ncbi:MAG: hypothetical protein JWN70_147 [Planctomycetaceae bacterium]|nr:hypothetical protein [Planctomycetaceae bacterium]